MNLKILPQIILFCFYLKSISILKIYPLGNFWLNGRGSAGVQLQVKIPSDFTEIPLFIPPGTKTRYGPLCYSKFNKVACKVYVTIEESICTTHVQSKMFPLPH